MCIKNKYNTLKRILTRNGQFLLLLIITFASCKNKPRYASPLTPEESMKTFHFAENFKAEIFATEPLVIDPVSMQFDEDGNAYVVGMLDAYKPDSVKGKGRIVMLKDLNGDGRADTAIVFADSIREASSILPWKGGLLIAAAPNIMYYKDTNGDGRADSKEILFTGFFNKNEEAQITNLSFGIDNWIYANNTGQAGEISFTRKPNAPKLALQGADFRFRLDRNQFERSTGPGQFGLSIDDWGHRFFTANSLHIRQVVIPLRYLERNPFLPSSAKAAVENISDHDPLMFQLTETPYWRQMRTDRRNKEYQEHHLDREEYARDHFTAASGGTIYEGDVFPKEYYGNIFTGDVSGNLVHRDILSKSDTAPYFIAKRAEQEKDKEFLQSTDSWFRPASSSVGPDGYLYVIDMYRQHIETPMSIPEDLQVGMDFNAGNKYGRIYRIVPENAGTHKKVTPNLKSATSVELVTMLTHQNRWWRLQAQRLLLERQDKSVLPAVKELLAQNEDPRFRLHALYVLEGMDALDAATVKAAMKDPSEGVRENAAILSERFPACLSQLEEMINDSSIRVAFEATLSLGEFKDNTVIPALAKVLELHGESSWFRTAVLSSEAGSSIDLLKTLEKNSFFKDASPGKLTFFEAYSTVIGVRNEKGQIVSLLGNLSQPFIANQAVWQEAGVKGLIKGLEQPEGLDASLKDKLESISAAAKSNIPKAIQDLKQLYAK
jgi:putative membrane-bound dehydrogenase-like protein